MKRQMIIMKLLQLLLFLVVTFSDAQDAEVKSPVKRSYVCPPNFIRLSHRCYYFSHEPATWQDAYFKCRDLHGNLAIIKNANQDKLIRRILSKKTLDPLERWLGGLYDWEQMTWKWAASGKPLVYQGFSNMEVEDKEKLRWHCIIMDPSLQYKWNTRSCLEKKNFICHTKIKIVTNKGKKKLLRQYNVTKYNKLNEIPVPILPEDLNNPLKFKENQLSSIQIDINNDINGQYATKPKTQKRRKTKTKRKRNKNKQVLQNHHNVLNGTEGYHQTPLIVDLNFERKRRNKNKEEGFGGAKYKWKTYFKEATINPLHPKAIVEEFNYVKEN